MTIILLSTLTRLQGSRESTRRKRVRIRYNQFRGSHHSWSVLWTLYMKYLVSRTRTPCFMLLCTCVYVCVCVLLALAKTTRRKLVSFSTWPTLRLHVYGYPRGCIKSRVDVSNKPTAVPATTWTVDHPPNKGLGIKRFPLFRKTGNIFLGYSVLNLLRAGLCLIELTSRVSDCKLIDIFRRATRKHIWPPYCEIAGI